MAHEFELEYAGFWQRFGATLIDAVLFFIVTLPMLNAIYGADHWLDERLVTRPMDFLISWVLPAIVVLSFWTTKGATPGKMAIAAQVVDERTGGKRSVGSGATLPASCRRCRSAWVSSGLDSIRKSKAGTTNSLARLS